MAAAGRQKPFLKDAFSIGGLVDALDTIVGQHLQLAGEFCQLFPAQNCFRLRAVRHNGILADSPFVRHGRF